MEGTRHLVIGGAYSVDKYYRLENNMLWFADEQPSAEIKTYVEDQITKAELTLFSLIPAPISTNREMRFTHDRSEYG